MSGEVSRSRQKKAAAGAAKKGQTGQNSQAAGLKYAKKKNSKERNNQNKKMNQKKSSSTGFLCSTWTLIILFTLTGISVASYHQYPEKVQAVYNFLPPQVRFLDIFLAS